MKSAVALFASAALAASLAPAAHADSVTLQAGNKGVISSMSATHRAHGVVLEAELRGLPKGDTPTYHWAIDIPGKGRKGYDSDLQVSVRPGNGLSIYSYYAEKSVTCRPISRSVSKVRAKMVIPRACFKLDGVVPSQFRVRFQLSPYDGACEYVQLPAKGFSRLLGTGSKARISPLEQAGELFTRPAAAAC